MSYAGSGTSPGNSSDPIRGAAGSGAVGTTGAGASGASGKVHISY
jgi:hypothetical protein